jgi:hypothetical protein
MGFMVEVDDTKCFLQFSFGLKYPVNLNFGNSSAVNQKSICIAAINSNIAKDIQLPT